MLKKKENRLQQICENLRLREEKLSRFEEIS